MLLRLINKPKVAQFCSFVKNHNLNQRAKVCGIDLKEDYLNFKLYIELLEVPPIDTIEEFLQTDVTSEFLKWSTYWDKTRYSSLAFGIKIDTQENYRKYFHVKFKPCFDQIMFERQFLFLRLLKINITSALKGISYEIDSDNKFYPKFYLYIREAQDIQKVLAYKKMLHNLDVKEIEELELYATETSFKINIINKIYNFKTKQKIEQTIPKELLLSLKECATILDCEPIYTGLTSSGTTSAYFSLTTKQNNILSI